MSQPTLQLPNDNLTITLPTVIRDVKRVKGGYRVLAEDGWKFYASTCLDKAQVDELEEWLIELRPGRAR